MKTDRRFENKSEQKQEKAEVAEFHNKRMKRELKIETKKDASNKPEGNYEYEQLVAEDASFNAKPMIEVAAFFIAERRGFVPGRELSDWLQAEAGVEGVLRNTSTERRKTGAEEDRRHENRP